MLWGSIKKESGFLYAIHGAEELHDGCLILKSPFALLVTTSFQKAATRLFRGLQTPQHREATANEVHLLLDTTNPGKRVNIYPAGGVL